MTSKQNISQALILLSGLNVVPANTINGQVAIHPAAAQRVDGSSTGFRPIVPKPSVDYEGTVDIDLPSVPTIHAQIHGSNNLVRYDFRHPIFQIPITMWADLNTGNSIKNSHAFGNHLSKPDMPLPGFEKVNVTNVHEGTLNDQNVRIFHIDNGEVMPGHLFRGDVYTNKQGVVILVDGDELNTDKCHGKYTHMSIRVTSYIEKTQDKIFLTPPILREEPQKPPKAFTPCSP